MIIKRYCAVFHSTFYNKVSAGIAQELQALCMPYTYHLKDANNHNTFLALTLILVNFKLTMSNYNSNSLSQTVKISRFTRVKCAMPIFINNILVSINFFHHLHLVHKINH